MSMITFIGFDCGWAGPFNPTSENIISTYGPTSIIVPPGVYVGAGFPTRNLSTNSATCVRGGFSHSMFGRSPSYTSRGGSAGNLGLSAMASVKSSVITAKGWRWAIERAQWLIGNEIWMTMDISHPAAVPSGTLAATFSPTDDYFNIFEWGDLVIKFKSTTSYSVTLSIQNNGVEVATVTSTLSSTINSSGTGWGYLKIHAKLDGSTGLIEVELDGFTQSAPYTGQNTVANISLATADGIYFGPMVAYDGTDLYGGVFDNVYFDDTAWPSGRPVGWVPDIHAASSGGSGWIPAGTASTVVDGALAPAAKPYINRFADTKGLRGVNVGSEYYFGIPLLAAGTSLLTTLHAVQVFSQNVHKRSGSHDNRFNVGLSTSTDTDWDSLNSITLPTDTSSSPPVNSGLDFYSQFTTRPGGGSFNLSDIQSNGVLRVNVLVDSP